MQTTEQAEPKDTPLQKREIIRLHAKNKRLDLINLWIPTYQLSMKPGNVALIVVGKNTGFVRKMPTKRNYFIDKDLGLFHINPENSISVGRASLYIYDNRNANPINPGLLDELYKWANLNKLYKIRRVDVMHAKKLRNKTIATLKEDLERQKREEKAFTNKVLAKIENENQETKDQQLKEAGGLDPNSEEYHLTTPDEARFLIVENMFTHGYIDQPMRDNLNYKLKIKEIKNTEELLTELHSNTELLVSEPIPITLERILDEHHTYEPKDVIFIIKELSKIYKGFKNLRSKPIMNWFPATYLLFGALGIVILLIMWNQYGGSIDLGSIFNP